MHRQEETNPSIAQSILDCTACSMCSGGTQVGGRGVFRQARTGCGGVTVLADAHLLHGLLNFVPAHVGELVFCLGHFSYFFNHVAHANIIRVFLWDTVVLMSGPFHSPTVQMLSHGKTSLGPELH
jgi:hypothetical protein